MTSCASIPGGLACLLAQTAAYDCLESCVALLQLDGKCCYRNSAAVTLDQNLRLEPDGGDGILSLPSLRSMLAAAAQQRAPQLLRATFYYSRNIPVVLTLCLRPIINLDSDAVDGAMLSIGEENIGFDRRHLATLQSVNVELAAQIKRLSRARIENERMIRILLSEMPIPLVVFDSDRRVVQLNRAAEVLFETPRRNAIGLRCSDYLNCYHDANHSCPVLDQHQRIDLEETIAASGVDSRHLLRTAVALREGDQAMVLEAFVDITQRKNVEEQLARYRLELEDIVTERTARLERTVSELESFSYSVSHDLRSPLRAIDGFSQALLDDYEGILDETAVGYINRSRKAAQRMGRLIDDLLQLSQIGRRVIQRQPADISAIAEEIAAELKSTAPSRHVEIQVQPALQAYAEPGLVHALLSNLIGNAWKFTSSHAHARIEVGGTRIGDDEVFYVRDNGIGFDMGYADRLFLPFHVLDANAAETGTGIGLATAQRIIHRHDGCIWAKAAPGEGAAFYFTLQP